MSDPNPQSPSAHVTALNVQSFTSFMDQELFANQEVMVFFDAKLCSTCREYFDIYQQAALTRPSVIFAYVDISKNELQETADVYTFPTIRLYARSRSYQ
jgi:thiol-disulfide isomerase/thioredoxin